MTDFVKVPDNLRSTYHDLFEALAGGDTTFLPLNGDKVNSVQRTLRNGLRNRGMKLHYRVRTLDGVSGLVMWADKGGAA